MPSISQAKLDELQDELERQRGEATDYHTECRIYYDRVVKFDAILKKVVLAANGMPLIKSTDGYGSYGNVGMALGGYDNGCACKPGPSDAERHENELRQLHERIVNLEGRLSAVVAVATFAQEHKG